MKKIVFIFLMVLANAASASNTTVLIHESVINVLLDTVGEICQDTITGNVCISHPKININGNNSGFTARAYMKFLGKAYKVRGKVNISADLANDKIRVGINNVVIENILLFDTLNVSKWYDPSFDLPIHVPQVADIMDKKVNIKQSNSRIVMGSGQIELHLDLAITIAQ